MGYRIHVGIKYAQFRKGQGGRSKSVLSLREKGAPSVLCDAIVSPPLADAAWSVHLPKKRNRKEQLCYSRIGGGPLLQLHLSSSQLPARRIQ